MACTEPPRTLADQAADIERLLSARPPVETLLQSRLIKGVHCMAAARASVVAHDLTVAVLPAEIMVWSSEPSHDEQPAARHGHTCSVVGRRLFVMGGRGIIAHSASPSVYNIGA